MVAEPTISLRPEVAQRVRDDERRAQALALELNRLVPGLLASGQGFGGDVLIGWLPPSTVARLIDRLRGTVPIAPYLDGEGA